MDSFKKQSTQYPVDAKQIYWDLHHMFKDEQVEKSKGRWERWNKIRSHHKMTQEETSRIIKKDKCDEIDAILSDIEENRSNENHIV